MQNLLPIPSIDYFPSALRNDEEIIALTDFLDAEYMRWFNDSSNLDELHDPARAPAICLNAFGDWLEAGIKEKDNDSTKRSKIANAIQNTRFLSTWFYSAKPLIDSIVGGNSEIISGIAGDDSIVCGDGNEPIDADWFGIGGFDSSLGYGTRIVGGAGIVQYSAGIIPKQADQMLVCGLNCDNSMLSFAIGGLDPDIGYGSRMLGDGSEYDITTADYVEPMIKGSILVNVDNSSLSASDIDSIKQDLKDIAPAYFKVYLGYLNGTGQTFVPYSNGLVGQ